MHPYEKTTVLARPLEWKCSALLCSERAKTKTSIRAVRAVTTLGCAWGRLDFVVEGDGRQRVPVLHMSTTEYYSKG